MVVLVRVFRDAWSLRLQILKFAKRCSNTGSSFAVKVLHEFLMSVFSGRYVQVMSKRVDIFTDRAITIPIPTERLTAWC